MKILSILGSPHGEKGNTGRLLSLVIEGAESAGAINETVALPGNTLLPCLACETCHIKGACPQKDGFAAVLDRVMAADGIILASPNYISNVSAQLKAFLDRCCGVLHRQGFSGKYGASVVTSGSEGGDFIALYLSHFLMTTGAVPVGSAWASMREVAGTDFPEPVRKKALALGRDLAAAIKEKRGPGPWEEASKAFRERMKSLVIWKQNEWRYEYEHWKKHMGLI